MTDRKCTSGLDDKDFAGEKAYVDILKAMGANIDVVDGGRGGITVEGGAELPRH